MSKHVFTLVLTVVLASFMAACNKAPKLNIPAEQASPNDIKPELSTEGKLRVAQRLEQAGDYEAAGGFYSSALNDDNTLIPAHLGLARVFTRIGRDDLAAISYGNAFEIDPGNYDVLKRYIDGLLVLEQPDMIIDASETYLENGPPTAELMNFMGIAYDLIGNYAAAEQTFRDGLALTLIGDTWNGVLLGNLALSLGLSGKTSEAILLLNPYIGDMSLGRAGISRFQSSLRQNLALVYALAGNPDSAVEVAKTALSEEDAEYNRPFYEAIASLSGVQRVRAVLFGELPG